MKPTKGLFKPEVFFQFIAAENSKNLGSKLIKFQFILSIFITVVALLYTQSVVSYLDPDLHPEFYKATIKTVATAIAFISSIVFIKGMVFTVIGKIFSVNERMLPIISSVFWATVLSYAVIFFIGVLLLILGGTYIAYSPAALDVILDSKTHNSLSFLILWSIAIATALSLTFYYLFFAVRISMQASKSETWFIMLSGLTLTHVLTASILLGITKIIESLL